MISCVTNTHRGAGLAAARVDELADAPAGARGRARATARRTATASGRRPAPARCAAAAARRPTARRSARRRTRSAPTDRDRVVDRGPRSGGSRKRKAAPVAVEPEPHEVAAADREVGVERVLLRDVADVDGCPGAARRPSTSTVPLVSGVSPSRTRSKRGLARAVRARAPRGTRPARHRDRGARTACACRSACEASRSATTGRSAAECRHQPTPASWCSCHA